MRILPVLIVLSLLLACKVPSHSGENRFKNLTTDSLFSLSLSDHAKALNIPQINTGVDSFELRIWHGLAIATPNQLMVLKYQDSSWQLTDTDYWFSYQWRNGSPRSISLDSSITRAVKPPSSILDIVDTLNSFRLDTFPSQYDIPGFKDKVADGRFYYIEVATPHYYKALYYANPHRYEDRYNQQIEWLLTNLYKAGLPVTP